MSRVSTSSAPPQSNAHTQLPYEKVAKRAYEKWCKRGCTHGSDLQDWAEAEKELQVEMSRSAPATNRR